MIELVVAAHSFVTSAHRARALGRPPRADELLAVLYARATVASARDVRAGCRAAGLPLADPEEP